MLVQILRPFFGPPNSHKNKPGLLKKYNSQYKTWICPAIPKTTLINYPQSKQYFDIGEGKTGYSTYWMWRFDRPDDDIPLDNFWGKTESQLIRDLIQANNPFIGVPSSSSDVELIVDVYYPSTIKSLAEEIKGYAVHSDGRNRLMLDNHIDFKHDKRLFKN